MIRGERSHTHTPTYRTPFVPPLHQAPALPGSKPAYFIRNLSKRNASDTQVHRVSHKSYLWPLGSLCICTYVNYCMLLCERSHKECAHTLYTPQLPKSSSKLGGGLSPRNPSAGEDRILPYGTGSPLRSPHVTCARNDRRNEHVRRMTRVRRLTNQLTGGAANSRRALTPQSLLLERAPLPGM